MPRTMRAVEARPVEIAVLAAAGMVAGLALLLRGFRAFGDAARIGDTSTSRIASLAIGEVRVSGVVQAAGLTLVSPLQSAPCVFYRSSISQSGDDGDEMIFEEERSIGFRVADGSGSVRVFPRDARFDVPARFADSTGPFGDSPPGLRVRTGSAFGPSEQTRDQQVRELLTVRPAAAGGLPDSAGMSDLGGGSRSRRYREARLEPGDTVTVLGRVLPFDQLPDPAGADLGGSSPDPAPADDAETLATIAAARQTGLLADSPEAAWGNAAIPGFGIGRPVSAPVLDPAAATPSLGSKEDAARTARLFEIAPSDLVLAAAPDAPLIVALGGATEAAARHEATFLVGLLGAVLAIGSALVLALVAGGGLAQ